MRKKTNKKDCLKLRNIWGRVFLYLYVLQILVEQLKNKYRLEALQTKIKKCM